MWSHDDEEKQHSLKQAKKLEEQGQEEEAFLAYLSMPGAQHLATRLARNHPQKYLGILREQMPKVEPALVKLIEGDLLLALGQKEEALAGFREIAIQIDRFTQKDWQEGIIPDDIYPVEPPMIAEHQLTRRERREYRRLFEGILQPFTIGPGSHRDNWLIRRFIALEAWDEAASEFERIWKIHQQQVLVRQTQRDKQLEKQQHHFKLPLDSVSPDQIDQRTLQFAIDYAYFLTQCQQQETSLNILLTLLGLMNIDKESHRYSSYLDADLSYKEFIRLAYGAFKEAGLEDKLIATLEQNITLGQNATRRVLARIRYHQGRIDEALALELAYLDNSTFDAITVAKRRGEVYEDANKIAEAAQSYQQALILSSQNKKSEGIHLFSPLCRLYGALGQTDKVLEMTLQQFEFQPKRFRKLSALEKAALKFQQAGQSSQFFHWVEQQLPLVNHAHAQANLYWLLGDYEKVLQSFDSQPELIIQFYSTTIAQKLRELDQEKLFFDWMRQKAPTISDDYDRAEFYWILRDYQAWAQILAPQLIYVDDNCSESNRYHTWRDRLPKLDKSEARLFLAAILKVDPQNARVQFDLFQLEENPSTELCIKIYEPLLEIEASFYGDFPFKYEFGERLFNKKHFKDYYDLAHQLMLLYKQSRQWKKLCTLCWRLALRQKPFAGLNFKSFLRQLNYCFSLLLQPQKKSWLNVFSQKFSHRLFNRSFLNLKWQKNGFGLKIPKLTVKLKKPNFKDEVEETVKALFENSLANKLLALLEKLLQSDNPLVRAEAIAALEQRLIELKENEENNRDETDETEDDESYRGNWPFVRYRKRLSRVDDAFLPLLIKASKDTEVRVRSTACYVLIASDNHPRVMPVLREKLTDSNRYIRAIAAVALIYRGEIPLEQIKEIFLNTKSNDFDSIYNYVDFPYGANASISILPRDYGAMYEALAPLANAEIFDLLLKYPPGSDGYDHYNTHTAKTIFQPLGQRLSLDPEVIKRILRIYPENRKLDKFISHLLVVAGTAILPEVHQGLSSPDRIVRSNAARASGIIKDSSSIPYLIKALDLESGLSRASIVWALGELKAKEALPHLIKLYLDFRHDDGRQRGAGYRFSQASATTYSHYEALRTLSDVGTQWHELKAICQPELIDPRFNEKLLSKRDIFNAIGKIGAENVQPFYQNMASETDQDAVYEAAIRLAEGDASYHEHNIQILRHLLVHTYHIEVHTAAAVSLLILGDNEKTAQQYILEWLESSDNIKQLNIFQQLPRIKDASKLFFAHKPLETIVTERKMNRQKCLEDPLFLARRVLVMMRQRQIRPVIREQTIDLDLWVPHLPAAEGEYLGVLEIAADCVTLSPDSRILATGSCRGKISAWDLHSHKMLWSCRKAHQKGIKDIAMSPDGKRLATSSSDTTVRIWDTAKGAGLFCCEGHEEGVEKVNWFPDGHYLASSSQEDHTIRVWNTHTGTCLQCFKDDYRILCEEDGDEDEDRLLGIEWSPDGNLLALRSVLIQRDIIQIWEVASRELLLDWRAGFVTFTAWSPNGRWLALAVEDNMISVWETQNWELVHQWKVQVHTEFSGLAWSPNSQLLASSDKQGISLWEPMTGQQIVAFKKKSKHHLIKPVWSPNGAFIAGCNCGDVIIFWDTRSYIQHN